MCQYDAPRSRRLGCAIARVNAEDVEARESKVSKHRQSEVKAQVSVEASPDEVEEQVTLEALAE